MGFVHWLVCAVWYRGVLEEGHGGILCARLDTAVTRENQLKHGCSQLPFKEQADTVESRDPQLSTESGTSRGQGGQGKQVKGR